MPTTKKVAPKAVSMKKDNKVITAPKNKTSKPSVVKNVLQTKKTRTIRSKNKTTKAVIKAKIDASAQSKKLHSKFSTLEALHLKNKQDVRKVTSKEISVPAKRSPHELVTLSPYRFPVNIHTQVVQTARYGGIFFVILGAIFTLFFANGTFSVNGQLAQVALTTSETTTTSTTLPTTETLTTLNCQDPLVYQSEYCKDKVDISPDAIFDIANRNNDLKGTVKIKLDVSYAQRVKLMGVYKNDGTSIELGLMKSVAPETWEFYWNTVQNKDGAYRLRVLIQNAHGSYEVVDTANLQVENTPFENIETTALQPTQEAEVEENSSEDAEFKPKLTTNVSESANEFRFEITDPLADTIKVYAFHVASAKKIFLGNMYVSSNDVFKYRWLASTFEAGSYKIIAQILTDGVPTYSSELFVTKLATVTSLDSLAQSALTEARETELDPEVSIVLPERRPFASIVPVQIEVKNAALIELYIQGKTSLIKKFVGVATMADIDTWSYRLDTTQVPNGEYVLIALVKNMYGSYEYKTQSLAITNNAPVTYTPIQIDQIETLKTVAADVSKQSSTSLTTLVQKTTPPPAILSDDAIALNEPTPLLDSEQTEKLQNKLQLLASALRIQDSSRVSELKTAILKLTERTATGTIQGESDQQNIVLLDSYIRSLILDTEESVFKTDKLIAERTKEKASEDTDKDGISNYDEVAIYQTDPFSSDTDTDGFNDASEILNGYNPVDAKPEALVSYQSPKDAGIVREDILLVTSITTEVKDDEQSEAKRPVALISGTALPNSFITLYIFSTPIVVTLKTDEDGGWNYRFDKELEDGAHEVYIGVTDNAGKIVAKSNAFSFVKEAEAFTGITTNENIPVAKVDSVDKSFLSEYMLYLVLSISTVAIGLVLIMLGLHLDTRQQKIGIITKKDEALV